MEKRYLTKNRSYTAPVAIRPQYVVVHSTGSGVGERETLFAAWNAPGATLSCHGMVDGEGAMLTLPVTYKANHIGSLGNGVSVGFEVCEPKAIAYADASHTRINTAVYDPAQAGVLADFKRRWDNAVLMAAYLCRETGLPAGRVLCHGEMFDIGKGTNHADVRHWFPLFGKGYDMDAFRAAVAGQLAGTAAVPPAPLNPGDTVAIVPGAVYGGLSALRGSPVPPAVCGRALTVSRVETHNGETEALLSEIYSWVGVR